MVCFILFRSQETKLYEKSTPLESSSEFLGSQNYKNTNDHPLVQARKIHKPVTYQALFSPLFKLVKNEERFELTFLDSLKFNRKDKEEVLSLGYR